MKLGFEFKPVAWMAGVLAVIDAVLAINEGAHLLPEGWTKWLLLVSAVLTAVLGRLVYNRVTPLADPKAANGLPLVPTPPARVPPGTPESALDATEDAPRNGGSW
jgi:hypothetical protein